MDYLFCSSIPMTPRRQLSCEGLGEGKGILPHVTGKETEAHVVGRRPTASKMAEQEPGWGPLPVDSVLCSRYPPNPEIGQTSPESPTLAGWPSKGRSTPPGVPPGA